MTATEARDEAKRLSKETGDIHCVAKIGPDFVVYPLGFPPAGLDLPEDDEGDE